MNIVSSSELIKWAALVKDISVSLAAFFTIGLGLYGIRQWKHEHRGTEAFNVVKELIGTSHKLARACSTLRRPVQEFERKQFSAEETSHTTANERWKLSEQDAFDKRFEMFKGADESYREALLNARALLGSHIYAAFLDFGQHVTENVIAVNNYLNEVLSDSFIYHGSDQSELTAIEERYLAKLDDSPDELEARTADAREAGEKALAKYLGRSDIRG